MKKHSFIQSRFYSLLGAAFVTEAVPMLLQISDSVIAGRMIGVDAVSAVELVTPICSMVSFMALMISVGCNILYGESVGAIRREDMSRQFSEGLISILAISVLCLTVSLLFTNRYLENYGADPQVTVLAKEYFTWYHLFVFFQPIFLYLSEMVLTEGDEKLSNICFIVYFGSNILVSIAACYFWGIRGIGFGTLVSILLSIGVLCLHFFNKTNGLKFSLRFGFRFREVLKMVHFSFMDASDCLFIALNVMIVNFIIIHRFGSRYLPVYAVVQSVQELAIMLDGVGDAMQPLISVFRGERNGAGEKKLMTCVLKTALVSGIVFAAAVMIASPFLPAVYGVTDPAIRTPAAIAAAMTGASGVCLSIVYLLASYYLMSEQIALATVMSMLNSFIFPCLFGIALCFPLGMTGLWLGILLAGPVTLALGALWIGKRYGRQRIPLVYQPETRDCVSCDLTLTVPEIMDLTGRMEAELRGRNMPEDLCTDIRRICEEVLQLILEKNDGTTVRAECTLFFDDDPELVIRDSGEIFDVMDEDLPVTSLRSMVVSLYMSHYHDKEHLVTTGYNRNVFILHRRTEPGEV